MRQVTRYQGWPGQATAYMVGRLGILNAREYATNALGEQFSLKDFHYQVMWLRECEFHDEFVDNHLLLLITLRRFWILVVHNYCLGSCRSRLLLFFSLNNTLLHIYIQRKNYKKCKRNWKKVVKLQFTKVIENYNLTYLYANTWKISNSIIYFIIIFT